MLSKKRILKKEVQKDERPVPLKNLGWLNCWEETPEIVTLCRKEKHPVSDIDVGPPHRGIEHVVKCEICKYVYRYDSSD